MALGNHEQEEGWHLGDAGFAVEPPIMSANARDAYFLNPDPLLGSFYTGNTDTSYANITTSSDHTIQDYYAWTWGDALFVIIDPYWYSTTKPYIGNEGGGESSTPGSGNRWDWTLGLAQYKWLEQTLQNSTAKYKFIFAHQVAGGLDDYGRGGAYAVPYVEWGGNNDDGTTWAFDTNRTDVNASWTVPVHQLLVDNHVTAFFHGHDHEYAHEQRDGIVYQEVPMAADATYGYGFDEYTADGVYTLKVLPNSGHLRVTVDPNNGVTVQYVRASLAAAGGTNGGIADSYNIAAPAASSSLVVSSVSLNPTTVVGSGVYSTGTVTLSGPVPSTSDGVQVTLTSSNPNAATVPAQPISIPAGSTTGTFTVTSQLVTASASTIITATATANGSGSAQATLTVNPAATGLTSLTLNPTSVVGGAANSNSTGTVTLNGFAPAGGTYVALSSSSNPSAATVPGSVTVPYNTASNTFQITSSSVTTSTPVTITATLNGSKTATLTVNPPPSFTPVRINSGGPAYNDSLGQPWKADTGYSGGAPFSVTNMITNTADPTLYKTSRYGASFSYAISAPAGTYSVTLKFAEPVWSAKGKRIFNVAINGKTVLSMFDILAAAGAEFKAVDEAF
ncbi:MAG: malectin domain-containing carbohydrate-binding protein, partial [Candidatus Acidiferrales bacterium]